MLVGSTWKRNVCNWRTELSGQATAVPMASPAAVSNAARLRTIDTTFCRVAPSAMRTPISFVALRHDVGHDAVDADRGDDEAEQAEEREQRHVEAALRDQAIHVALERDGVARQPLFLVDRPDRRLDRRQHRQRIAGRAHDQRAADVLFLGNGM